MVVRVCVEVFIASRIRLIRSRISGQIRGRGILRGTSVDGAGAGGQLVRVVKILPVRAIRERIAVLVE